MRISAEGLSLIKHFEGFSPVVYRDAAGLPTIGYGHLLTYEAMATYAQGLSRDAAETLLRQDATAAEVAVTRLISKPLLQNQFDALVCFTFNLGAGALQRSTLRRVINRGDEEVIGQQWMRFVWAGGAQNAGAYAPQSGRTGTV